MKSCALSDASGQRARVVDAQRGVRDDVVEVLAALAGEDRLVLVGEQHVAGAARNAVVASRPLSGSAATLSKSFVM